VRRSVRALGKPEFLSLQMRARNFSRPCAPLKPR
jgi:hypothetical protein